MTLFGKIGKPVFGPVVASLPALAPDAVGAASTMFASTSLRRLAALDGDVGRQRRDVVVPYDRVRRAIRVDDIIEAVDAEKRRVRQQRERTLIVVGDDQPHRIERVRRAADEERGREVCRELADDRGRVEDVQIGEDELRLGRIEPVSEREAQIDNRDRCLTLS